MDHHNPQPITPEKQISPSANTNLDSPSEIVDLRGITCTPKTQTKLTTLKRKADQLWDEGSPKTTSPFLKWRLAVLESLLALRSTQKQAIAEAGKESNEDKQSNLELLAKIKKDEYALLTEKTFILAGRKTLEEDLSDMVSSKIQLEEAYITELRMALEAASSSKDRLPGLKMPRLDRTLFQKIVNEYLGTKYEDPETKDSQKFCNVLGFWLQPSSVTCAHIVPYSWNAKDMAHMFGGDEPPLTSKRNGLSLQSKIEEAFDNCWLAIVPLSSTTSAITEWKIVLLNTEQRDKMFFNDLIKATNQRIWRWRDIDGRKLTFLNDNRPARRFLYMRYTLAWLQADDKSWEGFKEKVPPGNVWASPNKPDGYLRKSILLELGKRTGDKLPMDLIESGTFEDPGTSSIVNDEVAALRIGQHINDHLEGKRDPKKKNENDEEGSEDDDKDGDDSDDE